MHYGVTTYEGDDDVSVLVPKMTQKGQVWKLGDPVTTDTHKLGSAATLELNVLGISIEIRKSLIMLMNPQEKLHSKY